MQQRVNHHAIYISQAAITFLKYNMHYQYKPNSFVEGIFIYIFYKIVASFNYN